MRETNKARSAFEDYYNLGPGRSLAKLRQKYVDATSKSHPTRHLRTLQIWSSEHGWQDRVARRDQEIADAQMEEMKERAINTGYALFWKRVHDLGSLAERIYDLLKDGPLPPPMLREYRGFLDDIASEMGDRTKGMKLIGDPDAPLVFEDLQKVRDERWESFTESIAVGVDDEVSLEE